MHPRIVIACFLAGLGAAGPAAAADPERGRALYEQRCTACHTQSVHARAKRVASDYAEIRGWVERWSGTLSLGWSGDEIEDVTAYLNATYYRYPLPAPRAADPLPTALAAATPPPR
jgi:mono/diheme cytochrome c family protein